ncbi:zinc finger protein VAR3, chloroplastic-like [Silene latifolia]|uniref:zinc finger protein VAR3, chloroplastic-like n=1 Tax=Silene latifolia TaxID=37657 RepID=UPI003D76EDC7
MFLRTTTPHSLFHFTAKPSIPKPLIFSRVCTTSATVSPQSLSSPSPPPPHPWPEWVSFVDRLKSRGYFPNSSSGDGVDELVYGDVKLLKNPCLSFARDRFDVFKSLSKDDIQNVVEIGCPTLVRKVVNSAKRLREYVGLEEKNVCDVCSLRESCDRAYLKPNDSSLVGTVDIMRLLLLYALNPMVISEAVRTTSNEQAESSVRRLLSMLMDLSEAPKSPVTEEIPYKKEKIVNSTATVVSQAIATRKQDWVCPKCKYLNYARNTQCRNCVEDVPKKKESVHIELKKGDWNCPQCGSLNFSRRTVCFQCTTTRPPESLNPGEWVCSRCNFLNFRRNVKCLKCETEPVKEAASEDNHLWIKPVSRQMS